MEFQPYTLESYRGIKPKEYQEISKLKPDLNTDVLKAKRANQVSLSLSLVWGLGGYLSILVVSHFMWSAAFDSSHVLLPYPLITNIAHDQYTDIYPLINIYTYKHIYLYTPAYAGAGKRVLETSERIQS